MKSRKRYTAEFKAQTVEIVRLGRPVAEVAGELGIGADLVYYWKRQADQKLMPGQAPAPAARDYPAAAGK